MLKDDPVKKTVDLSGGAGADRVIEATGNPPTVTEAINIARTRGNVTLAGSHLATTEISSNKIIGYESTLHDCTTGEDFPRAISLLDKLEVEPIITHRLSLGVAERAFKLLPSKERAKVPGLRLVQTERIEKHQSLQTLRNRPMLQVQWESGIRGGASSNHRHDLGQSASRDHASHSTIDH